MNNYAIIFACLLSLPCAIRAEQAFADSAQQETCITQEEASVALLHFVVNSVFTALSQPELSDDEVKEIAVTIFDQAAKPSEIDQDVIEVVIAQLHEIIHNFGYAENTTCIMHNLDRIAGVTTNEHIGTVLAYVKEHSIDMSNPVLILPS